VIAVTCGNQRVCGACLQHRGTEHTETHREYTGHGIHGPHGSGVFASIQTRGPAGGRSARTRTLVAGVSVRLGALRGFRVVPATCSNKLGRGARLQHRRPEHTETHGERTSHGIHGPRRAGVLASKDTRAPEDCGHMSACSRAALRATGRHTRSRIRTPQDRVALVFFISRVVRGPAGGRRARTRSVVTGVSVRLCDLRGFVVHVTARFAPAAVSARS